MTQARSESQDSWVVAHAQKVAAFYETLKERGLPEPALSGLTQEFNHQSLRGHFTH